MNYLKSKPLFIKTLEVLCHNCHKVVFCILFLVTLLLVNLCEAVELGKETEIPAFVDFPDKSD